MARTKKPKNISVEFIKTKIDGVDIYVFVTQAKHIVNIGYVSERGVKEEKAAVQRIFSQKRVDDIAKFVAAGGGFFSPFILNWNNTEAGLKTEGKKLSIPVIPGSAQFLDGQHRFRGIQKAIEEKNSKGDENVVVILTTHLETKDAANIFTNINSKQQSVSKSLIYDLFKELGYDPNHKINRANDIATALNTNESSPFIGRIKFPGRSGGFQGMLQLSAVIDSLQDHLGPGGSFEKRNIKTLEVQISAIINFFTAISLSYEEVGLWSQTTKNPFLGAAGFRAGIEVLTGSVLDKSAEAASLKVEFFKKLLALDSSLLITKDNPEFKTLGGKEQVKYIVSFITKNLDKKAPNETDYEL